MLSSAAIFTLALFAAIVSSAPQIQTTSPAVTPVCSQPRSSTIPSAADLLALVKPQIPSACESLEIDSGNIASDLIEGYEFYSVPAAANATECEQAFETILSQCVEQQMFYSGEIVLAGTQVYILTNARGSLNPILSGPGAVQASSSILVATPAMPRTLDLTIVGFSTSSPSSGQSSNIPSSGTIQATTSQVGSISSSSSTFTTITPSSSLTQPSSGTQASRTSTYSQASFFPLIPTSNTAGYISSPSIQSSDITPPPSSSFFPLVSAPHTITSSTSLGNNGSIISATSTSPSSASTFSAISTPTLNCQQNIPPDGPSPSQIANALQAGNGAGNGVGAICAAGTFDELGDSTHMTFHYGSIGIELIRSSPTQPLTHCNDALSAIIATCIMGSADYGGIYSQDGETYNITNLIAPANPLAFPPSSQTTAPPTPSQIRSNNHGSALCDTLAGSCKVAYTGYNDTWLYTGYASYLADPGDKDATNLLWSPLADDGCAAMFTCDNDAAYSVGMLGSQIKAA